MGNLENVHERYDTDLVLETENTVHNDVRLNKEYI
jgi:hypothetical protein